MGWLVEAWESKRDKTKQHAQSLSDEERALAGQLSWPIVEQRAQIQREFYRALAVANHAEKQIAKAKKLYKELE